VKTSKWQPANTLAQYRQRETAKYQAINLSLQRKTALISMKRKPKKAKN